MDIQLDLLLKFLAALGLGALVGAEREIRKGKELATDIGFAGFRTYSLVAILGFVGAYLGDMITPWILLILLGAVTVFFLAEHFNEARKLNFVGITSEIAALITFLIGVITFYSLLLAVILTVVTVLTLNFKKPLHSFIRGLETSEFLSAVKFIIVAFVILPILPKEPIDPWGVISLFDAWLMVVFVSGISFAGYILVKTIGANKGLGISALLGGLASSTATTISMAQQGKKNKAILIPFAFAIVITSTVMFGRGLFEVAVVNRNLFPPLAIILGAMILVSLIILVVLAIMVKREKTKTEELTLSSPFRLWPALQFGLLYIFILVVSELGNKYFGQTGVYLASVISGLADVDAIILSLSNLASEGKLPNELAVRGIAIAVMVNTLVKLFYVRIFGTTALFRHVSLAILPILLAGFGMMVFI